TSGAPSPRVRRERGPAGSQTSGTPAGVLEVGEATGPPLGDRAHSGNNRPSYSLFCTYISNTAPFTPFEVYLIRKGHKILLHMVVSHHVVAGN
ncbi:hypothetical protein LEMLEM_LOCUS1185, partial [Lemmus lemmus]